MLPTGDDGNSPINLSSDGHNEWRFSRYWWKASRLSETPIPAAALYSNPAANNSILCCKRGDVLITSWKMRLTWEENLQSVERIAPKWPFPDLHCPQNIRDRRVVEYFHQQLGWKLLSDVRHYRLDESSDIKCTGSEIIFCDGWEALYEYYETLTSYFHVNVSA